MGGAKIVTMPTNLITSPIKVTRGSITFNTVENKALSQNA